jgi:hypothetical protein
MLTIFFATMQKSLVRLEPGLSIIILAAFKKMPVLVKAILLFKRPSGGSPASALRIYKS